MNTEKAKTGLHTFSFSRRYSRKTCVRIVNDYRTLTHSKIFYFEKSKNQQKKLQIWNLIFSKIGYLRSRWLRRHSVGIVNDYTDTSMTTRTLFENFESFSQILKEQSGKKMYLGVFTHPIAIIKKSENCRI